MKRKSGIAAIILSGAIVFAVAGDIRPVSATVSGLPAENSVSSSEYTDSSSNDLEQLKNRCCVQRRMLPRQRLQRKIPAARK